MLSSMIVKNVTLGWECFESVMLGLVLLTFTSENVLHLFLLSSVMVWMDLLLISCVCVN